MELGALTWTDLVDRHPYLLVPFGSTEQHGPHLPLDTDSRIAVAVAAAVTGSRGDLALAGCVGIGASGEHDGFPGTLSVGSAVLEEMVVEIARSADHFAGIVLLNAHGGNIESLERAAARLVGEGRRVLVVNCTVAGGDAHAGRSETSMMLALDAGVVRMDRAVPGTTSPWPEIREAVRSGGVRAVAVNGVLGDPTGASAEEGRRLLGEMVDRALAAVARWVDDESP